MSVVDELVKGREAFEHREWAAAHDRLSAVDRSKLSQDDLLRLGMAAYLSGDDESSVRPCRRRIGRPWVPARRSARCASPSGSG